MKTQKLVGGLIVPVLVSLIFSVGCDLGDKNVGDENDAGSATGGGDVGDESAEGSGDDGGTYDPCDALSCGSTCSTCPPDDPDCIETAEIKVCNDVGACVSDSGDVLCGPYEPCADSMCGDTCTACAPNDPDCEETEEAKSCNADGECVSDFGGVVCEPVWDPCGALACGDLCMLCPPQGMGDDDCGETADIKVCTAGGVCVSDSGEDLMCGAGTDFACGDDLVCMSDAQYCDITVPGQPKSETQYACPNIPEACLATPTCDCLEAALGFGGASDCTELPDGGINVETSLP